jgi:hypothetical protein
MPTSKSYFQVHEKEFTRPYKIHPVWRGIGFLMMLIVPIISWAGAQVTRDLGRRQGWAFMRELSPTLQLPEIFYALPVISSLAHWISGIYDLPVLLLFFFVLLVVFSSIMSLLYALIYRLIGPPRYTPLDAPAAKNKGKRYTR